MLWIKPNGTEIETNDRPETEEYVRSLGWKKKPGRKKVTDADGGEGNREGVKEDSGSGG